MFVIQMDTYCIPRQLFFSKLGPHTFIIAAKNRLEEPIIRIMYLLILNKITLQMRFK